MSVIVGGVRVPLVSAWEVGCFSRVLFRGPLLAVRRVFTAGVCCAVAWALPPTLVAVGAAGCVAVCLGRLPLRSYAGRSAGRVCGCAGVMAWY